MPRAQRAKAKPEPVLSEETGPAKRSGLFGALGLQGLDALAPVLVAALATEEPLLLIGPHGTGKTLLLIRVASALGLTTRHYNASLLNFDDLVGFPLPGKNGELEYVKTPAAIWGAGAVIFDEISRCRPDIQNKLFPIIHERRVQGLPLDGLRYRWAAMNPPSNDDEDHGYLGSEPLDTALADRFALIVEMPGWTSLSEVEQIAVIQAEDAPVDPEAAQALCRIIAHTRATLTHVKIAMAEGAASYVRTLVALLGQAQFALSPRRAGMLYRSILAVHAAAMALDPSSPPADSALLAVRSGLPQRAQGIPIPEVTILAAHREAWRFANIQAGDPLRAILTTVDPVERIRLAVAAPALPRGEFSTIVADGTAAMSPGVRDAVVVHLFESAAIGRLNAAVAEQLGEVYRDIVAPVQFSEAIYAGDLRFKTWERIKNLLSRLDPNEPRASLQANAQPTPLFFIFHLLGEWRGKTAYRPLTRLLRCPGHEVVFGDAITSTTHRVMAAVFDADPQPLYEIILDPNAEQFVRSRMCETLAMLVRLGELDRDLISRFFRDAFHGVASAVAILVWQSAIAMLGLSELQILVKRAFDGGFIDPHWIGFDGFLRDLEWALKQPGESRHPHDDEFTLFGDTVDELSRWYGFSDAYLADGERRVKQRTLSEAHQRGCAQPPLSVWQR